jgi:hypothetical protein
LKVLKYSKEFKPHQPKPSCETAKKPIEEHATAISLKTVACSLYKPHSETSS